MARRKLDQYFRAGTAWLVRETGKPVALADGDLGVNRSTPHGGVVVDGERSAAVLQDGAAEPGPPSASLSPGQVALANGDLAVNGSAPHDGVVAEGEETLIFGAVLPPALSPGQVALANGDLAVNGSAPHDVNGSAPHDGVVIEGEETLIFGAVLPPALSPGQVALANGDRAVNGSTPHDGAVKERERSAAVRQDEAVKPGPPIPPSLAPVQSVEPVQPAPEVAATAQARPRSSWFTLAPLGLICILTIQAILSLRLVWSNTAFLDEATYLFDGHVVLAHWLTGTSVPAYAAYLSGAPVIYPPLGALANDLGGLAAARILSMCFMLGATCFLWGMTSRLADRRSAFFAAAIFAGLGSTQYLGAFATYDPMSLFLMTAAAWCAVAARDHPDSTLLVLAGAALLALANACKYMTTLFDPVIIVLAFLSVASKRGIKPGLGRAGYVAVASLGAAAGLLGLGGSYYINGILISTVVRPYHGDSPLLVLRTSAHAIGLVLLLAALGVVVAVLARQNRFQVAIFTLLAVAGLLVPLEQARIHTLTSLSKHLDFGGWFAAAAAGYALARLSRVGPSKLPWKLLQVVTVPLALGVVLYLGTLGRAAAGNFTQIWPNTTVLTADLQSLTRSYPGNYLAEDYDVPEYYLENSIPWQRWFNTWHFTYTRPGTGQQLTNLPAYSAAIQDHFFSLIILDFGDTAQFDRYIAQDIRKSGDYHIVEEARYWDKFGTGQFTIWAYQPPRQVGAQPPRQGRGGNS